MDWIDIGLVGYLVMGVFYGLRRGLVWVGFSLLGYIAGVLIADHVAKPVTNMVVAAAPVRGWLDRYIPSVAAHVPGARLDAWNLAEGLISLLIFLIIVGAAEFVGRTVGAVASRGVSVFRMTALINRVGGVIAGLVEHGVVAGLILTLALGIPALAHSPISAALRRAPLAGTLIDIFKHVVRLPGGKYL